MSQIIQFKRGTKLALETANIILAVGEAVWEMDTNLMKIGDGVTTYTNLEYITSEPQTALEVPYDNLLAGTNGLSATNVQDAIDELHLSSGIIDAANGIINNNGTLEIGGTFTKSTSIGWNMGFGADNSFIQYGANNIIFASNDDTYDNRANISLAANSGIGISTENDLDNNSITILNKSGSNLYGLEISNDNIDILWGQQFTQNKGFLRYNPLDYVTADFDNVENEYNNIAPVGYIRNNIAPLEGSGIGFIDNKLTLGGANITRPTTMAVSQTGVFDFNYGTATMRLNVYSVYAFSTIRLDINGGGIQIQSDNSILFRGTPTITADNHITTKKYVDDAIAAGGGGGFDPATSSTIDLGSSLAVDLTTLEFHKQGLRTGYIFNDGSINTLHYVENNGGGHLFSVGSANANNFRVKASGFGGGLGQIISKFETDVLGGHDEAPTSAAVRLYIEASSIDIHADVDTTSTTPVLDNVLKYDGTNWIPGTIVGTGPTSIDALTDVDTTTTAPALNDVLQWDGTNWIPAVSSGGDPDTINFLDLNFVDLETFTYIVPVDMTYTSLTQQPGTTATVKLNGVATNPTDTWSQYDTVTVDVDVAGLVTIKYTITGVQTIINDLQTIIDDPNLTYQQQLQAMLITIEDFLQTNPTDISINNAIDFLQNERDNTANNHYKNKLSEWIQTLINALD